jgi:2-polyprenyl-6-methoxyphenol hydroxylase-like FAD-dependent oxidoreductase
MALGRACLLGDAAFVVRPHTAAATAKAASDAMTLADALAGDPGDTDAALRAWEARQLEHGRCLVDRGIALGKRSVEPRDDSGAYGASSREAAERFGGIAPPLQCRQGSADR